MNAHRASHRPGTGTDAPAGASPGTSAEAPEATGSLELRYGVNPHLRPATATPLTPGRWPLRVVSGTPSYVNLLDALGGWRLVSDLRAVLGRAAATSVKHVSPAGAAVDGPLDAEMVREFGVDRAGLDPADLGDLGPAGRAYVRARDGDPISSYGDFVAVSEPVGTGFARLLRRLVCDGIIAPGYDEGSVAILARKKRGTFLVLEADPDFVPPDQEVRDVAGLRLVQPYDHSLPDRALVGTTVDGHPLPAEAVDDLLLGHVVLKHTQSNSVAYLSGGMALGIGAGQQSRIDCTRLAGVKADGWFARRRPATGEQPEGGRAVPAQEGLVYVSDGMLPFRDNVDEAARHGVAWIAEPGGSVRSGEVAQACTEHGIGLVRTGLRLFHH